MLQNIYVRPMCNISNLHKLKRSQLNRCISPYANPSDALPKCRATQRSRLHSHMFPVILTIAIRCYPRAKVPSPSEYYTSSDLKHL